VLDYAAIDATDRAIERAARIEDWRRATVYADLAAHLAKAGRAEQARAALLRAEEARQTVEGWQGPRVSAHVAQALAEMGDVEASRKVAQNLAANDARQYAARSAATIAAGHAAAGQFDAAMAELAAFDDKDDFEMTWWRTAGYLGVARQTKLSFERRGQALHAARKSAQGIAGWKRAEALESIGEEYRLRGDTKSAREALEQAEADVRPLPAALSIKAPLLSNLARGWARLDERKRARELLDLAAACVTEALLIDQPAIWANVASSWIVAQDATRAWEMYDRALTAAQELVNPRPRALAVVGILRSIGRANLALPDPFHQRLETLLAGL
jgi:tetratricopeptide (TPR) repeat protein